MTMNQQSVSDAHNQAAKGVGAQTLLEIMGPIVEERKNRLIDEFARTEPSLPILLDIRAKLLEVRRIQKELERVYRDGADAAKALRTIAAGE